MNLAMSVALGLAVVGMACLCLGQAKHFKQVWARQPGVLLCKLIRAVGWVSLAASFAGSVAAWGWAIGPIGWFGLISLAGWMVAMGLPYVAGLRPHKA